MWYQFFPWGVGMCAVGQFFFFNGLFAFHHLTQLGSNFGVLLLKNTTKRSWWSDLSDWPCRFWAISPCCTWLLSLQMTNVQRPRAPRSPPVVVPPRIAPAPAAPAASEVGAGLRWLESLNRRICTRLSSSVYVLYGPQDGHIWPSFGQCERWGIHVYLRLTLFL